MATIGPNYVTQGGLRQMYDELRALLTQRPQGRLPLGTAQERAEAAALGASIARLESRIVRATLVEPSEPVADEVSFGANVTLRTDGDEEIDLSIVGIDEAVPEEGRLAHTSPEAKALLGRRCGDTVHLRIPQAGAPTASRGSVVPRLESGVYPRVDLSPFRRCTVASISYPAR